MFLFDVFRIREKLNEPWSKYYSEEDRNPSIPNVSLYEQVVRSCKKYPKNTAFQYYGKKTNYTKLVKRIDHTADALVHMGIQKGDIVTISLPNIPEVLFLFYGLNKIGAIANMVHPLSSGEELKNSLLRTGSHYLFMLDQTYPKVSQELSECQLDSVVLCSAASSLPFFLKIGYAFKNKLKLPKGAYLTWKKFRNTYEYFDTISYPTLGRDTACAILHSGGTSGTPKDVVIQNRSFILGAKQTGKICLNLGPGDSCLAIMPNFHGFGLSVCIHTPLTLGCFTTLVPTFDSKKFDVLFQKTKPTCVLGVPTLFEALLNCHNVKDLDLSGLKFLICGGDSLSDSLEKRINSFLMEHGSSTHVVQGYGLSEALAAVTLCFDHVYKKGSIGIPLAGNHVQIFDNATRKPLPNGEIGEICVHSKAYMAGYLNNEVETNKTLQVHDDGHVWLHTGDLGYMDDDGFVFYTGREKRMIVTSGYNVYPSYVESIIEEHPAVLECTIVGVPHPYKQEVPKAFIVLKEGYYTLLVKNDIEAYCKKRLTKYMVPASFVYRKRLPKTQLGKVDFMSLKNDTGDDDE